MIKHSLDAYVTATRKIWPDRSKTVGASEIGSCARRIGYLKAGQPPDDDYVNEWGAAMRGNLFEDHLWVPALRRRFGAQLKYAGKQQKTFRKGHLSATPDGILTGLKRNFLAHLGVPDIKTNAIMVECKTADPRTNLDKAKHNNIMQTQVQMGLIRQKTKYRPLFSLLSYADASFLNRIYEFVIPFDPEKFKAAETRATQIITAAKPDDLKPEGWIAGGSECRHCPFLKPCGIERRNLPFQEVTAIDPQKKAEIADMVREANKLEYSVDAYSSELREQQLAIKNRLRELGIRKIPGVVTWTSVKGRISYDDAGIRAAAQRAGINVEEYSRVGEPTDRLSLGEIGADE